MHSGHHQLISENFGMAPKDFWQIWAIANRLGMARSSWKLKNHQAVTLAVNLFGDSAASDGRRWQKERNVQIDRWGDPIKQGAAFLQTQASLLRNVFAPNPRHIKPEDILPCVHLYFSFLVKLTLEEIESRSRKERPFSWDRFPVKCLNMSRNNLVF